MCILSVCILTVCVYFICVYSVCGFLICVYFICVYLNCLCVFFLCFIGFVYFYFQAFILCNTWVGQSVSSFYCVNTTESCDRKCGRVLQVLHQHLQHEAGHQRLLRPLPQRGGGEDLLSRLLGSRLHGLVNLNWVSKIFIDVRNQNLQRSETLRSVLQDADQPPGTRTSFPSADRQQLRNLLTVLDLDSVTPKTWKTSPTTEAQSSRQGQNHYQNLQNWTSPNLQPSAGRGSVKNWIQFFPNFLDYNHNKNCSTTKSWNPEKYLRNRSLREETSFRAIHVHTHLLLASGWKHPGPHRPGLNVFDLGRPGLVVLEDLMIPGLVVLEDLLLVPDWGPEQTRCFMSST